MFQFNEFGHFLLLSAMEDPEVLKHSSTMQSLPFYLVFSFAIKFVVQAMP